MPTQIEQFVTDLAGSKPIITDDDELMNYCYFCQEMWPESDYDSYLANETKIQTGEGGSRLKFSHHKADCWWVRANALLRSA